MPVELQGVQPERYQVIPRVLVFATRGEDVLLIKGSPTKRVWPDQYNGVGGHVEAGEDLLSAARREFMEETGVALVSPKLSALVMIDTQKPIGINMAVFRGLPGPGDLIHSDEGTLHWVNRENISSLDLVEDLPILLPRVLALPENESPLFAIYKYEPNGNLVVQFANENG
jgi:8-oxo-dGTP diphosphatase